MKKRGLATAVLAASAAGAAGFGWLASSSGGFLAGLLAHGCLAATIGGLADWFAVTAIFRKPLGISYRTEILRRNRPRIMRALAEFSGSDLLSREHVMESLSKQDFSEMLAQYLLERGGRERLCALADEVFTRGVETMEMREVAAVLEPPVRRVFSDLRLDEMAGEALRSALSPETRGRALRALAPIARKVWRDEGLQAMLLASIGNIKEAYVGDQTMRASLFDMEELSDERLLERLNEAVGTWADELESGEGEMYARLSGWFDAFLRESAQREQLLAAVRRWQAEQVEHADVADQLARALELLRTNCLPDWRQKLRGYIEQRIEGFLSGAEARTRFNAWVLRWFDRLLAAHHDQLPQMMERQLAKMSDDALVGLVETRVEDDLQMIRINGAVVGSVAGMLLYLLTTAAERMWA
ncbi:MAG: DUF445 domain-containing protein [Schwartzia sp.]|nr:DUF445 domain-containing protein [Schwartzia sp. (in: firmicutes)]